MTDVLLVSGGLDSTVAADFMPDATLLHVSMGRSDSLNESAAVELLFSNREVHRINLQEVGGETGRRGEFAPGRNTMLAALANRFGDRIWFSRVDDDIMPDHDDAFFQQISKLLTESSDGRRVVVDTALRGFTKLQAVRRHLDEFKDEERLLQTFSCYWPAGGQVCRRCLACVKRWHAFTDNGLKLPWTLLEEGEQ